MKQGYSFKNLSNKLTNAQKIGAIATIVATILTIVLVALLIDNLTSSNGEEEGSNPIEETSETMATGEEFVIDGMKYTANKTTTVNENGETVVTETKEDEYGNVTTMDPNLITTYFPYQKMREHSDWGETLRYSLGLDEENKIINVLIEYCDEAADRELVQKYLNSVQVDLSAYTVNYETFSEDAICTEATGW